MRVIVPLCPAPELSPNYAGHWGPEAKAKEIMRKLAKYSAWESRPVEPLRGHVVLEARIGWTKGRKRMDRSNAAAALKALCDGLQDAGYFLNDREVDIVVVEQIGWGAQDGGTRASYPGGFVSVDIVQPGIGSEGQNGAATRS
jgi:hypothetical protein